MFKLFFKITLFLLEIQQYRKRIQQYRKLMQQYRKLISINSSRLQLLFCLFNNMTYLIFINVVFGILFIEIKETISNKNTAVLNFVLD